MTSPDTAPDDGFGLLGGIFRDVGALYARSRTEGIRDGVELAAQVVAGAHDAARDSGLPSEFLAFLADLSVRVRLCAWQITDPEEAAQ